MFVLLPLLSYLVIVVDLGNIDRSGRWGVAALRAAVLWGVAAVLITEVLSVFQAVTTTGLSLSWLLLSGAGIGWLGFHRSKGNKLILPRIGVPVNSFDRFLYISILVILLLTLLVAILSPPNTWDSLNYHMSRVAHWAQMKSVRHFATGIEIQNSMPPGAEMMVLHLYVLGGGDQWVILLQWAAMLICLMGVVSLVSILGGGRTSQLFAAFTIATLPNGILQATSTMTDYVVALWTLAAVAEAILIWTNQGSHSSSLLIAATAAGLGLLTKPTAAAFMLPIGLFIAWGLIRRLRVLKVIKWALIAAFIVLLVNGGHFYRNQMLYGNPISPPNRLDKHVNQLIDLRGLTSNVTRNASLHLGSPSPHINKGIALVVIKVHEWMGLDVNDPRTTSEGTFKIRTPSAHETQAGNLPQFVWAICVLALLIIGRQKISGVLLGLILVVSGGFLLFSVLFQWQIFAGRYHLPLFVVFALIFGVTYANWPRIWIPQTAAVLMLLWTFPWLFGNNSRPLISWLPGNDVGSVLTESRETVLFANGPYLQDPYQTAVDTIRRKRCSSIGIMLQGNSAEYPIWYLLGAPDRNLRIEWIVSGTPSEVFRDPAFAPCAVICENCPIEQTSHGDLQLESRLDSFQVFLEGG